MSVELSLDPWMITSSELTPLAPFLGARLPMSSRRPLTRGKHFPFLGLTPQSGGGSPFRHASVDIHGGQMIMIALPQESAILGLHRLPEGADAMVNAVIKTTWFRGVPIGSTFEIWAELRSGHAQFEAWMTDSDPQTPDVHGVNKDLLRTPMNPIAALRMVVAGPAGTVALVHGSVVLAGTQGTVTLRVVDQGGTEIRKVAWTLETDSGQPLNVGDYLNGIHVVQPT